jgi:uncharacterized protein YndB with AHSA1/START domain
MNKASIVETQLLIRRPANEVFNAFVDPAVTTNFWFTKSSGKLEKGKRIKWEWEMYGVSTEVFVKDIVKDKLISTEWGSPPVSVDYEFTSMDGDNTYVVIRCYGFEQKGDELIAVLKDNTGGFTSVLDGLKAWLEHGIRLNLVLDKFPDKWNSQQQSLNDWQAKI